MALLVSVFEFLVYSDKHMWSLTVAVSVTRPFACEELFLFYKDEVSPVII